MDVHDPSTWNDFATHPTMLKSYPKTQDRPDEYRTANDELAAVADVVCNLVRRFPKLSVELVVLEQGDGWHVEFILPVRSRLKYVGEIGWGVEGTVYLVIDRAPDDREVQPSYFEDVAMDRFEEVFRDAVQR